MRDYFTGIFSIAQQILKLAYNKVSFQKRVPHCGALRQTGVDEGYSDEGYSNEGYCLANC